MPVGSDAGPPVILLPPSEGKAEGGDGPRWRRASRAFGQLDRQRRAVRDAVRDAVMQDEAAAARLLGARGASLTRALAYWGALDTAPTRPAALRYTGVVWRALDPAGLTPAVRRRLDERVLVPSGLWGLSAATDGIPAYRLPMGARVPPLGGLAAYWRPHLAPLIAARAGAGWIIDLLPAGYAAALDAVVLGGGRHVRVRLVERDGARAIGHAGKELKGLLARAILAADARDPAALAELEVPGLTRGVVTPARGGEPAAVTFARTEQGSAARGS